MCCNLSPKTLRCSGGFLTILAIIILAVLLALNKISSAGYSTGNIFVESSINWYREVIINVNTVDPKTGKCTQDNQPLYEFKFKGLKSGCDCTNNGGTVTTSSCSSSQSTCQSVKSIKETVLQNWVDSSGNPIRLCFQRLYNYKFSQKFLKEGKCRDPSNEKMCGGSDPMTAFCVPKNSKCPVQSISTTKINPTDEAIGTTGLWMQRDIVNQGHMSEAYISEKEGMCPDYLYRYFDGVTKPYALLVDTKTFEKCTVDTVNWKKIQDIPKADFYKANNLDSTNFPGLVNSQTQSLQQRKYLPWKMECRGGTELEDMVQIAINYISDVNNHEMFFKVAAGNIGFLAAYLFLLMLGCFTTQLKRKCCVYRGCCKINCCCCPCLKEGCTISWCTIRSPQCIRKWWMKKDGQDSCWDYFKLVDPLHLIFIFVKFALDLAMIGLAAMNFTKVKSYKGTMSTLAKKNCSTDDFNSSLQSTSDKIDSLVIPLDTVVLAIMVVYLVGSIWAVITYSCNQVSKRRQILRQKLELKKIQILDDADQTLPTILSSENIQNQQTQNQNNSIQMQLNPGNGQNPYLNNQNPYTPAYPQGQQYPAQVQPYQQTGYPNQPMFQQPQMYPPQQPQMYPPQQPQMYPQQQPYQATPVYFNPQQ